MALLPYVALHWGWPFACLAAGVSVLAGAMACIAFHRVRLSMPANTDAGDGAALLSLTGRCAKIRHNAAALIVEGIFDVTVFMAEKIAMLSRSIRGVCISSIALRTMSAFYSSSESVRGRKILTTASVMNSDSGLTGTSIMKT
ncbi:hypothetical protein [Mycetohabitans rhizoxinica]|uniref:hypothetical protein n=1 Tax=Mycetohabitans sp. B6 TaxID=2841843 RepID=UPI00138B1080|nr:hypothetical protein [Mycetohabitans sp. B6]